ncbi:MAG: transketolase C-terminal domain-containing protein, partial [Phycisphaerales bacterium]
MHHGFCDVSILRTLPDAALVAAMDEPSLIAALEFMAGYDEGLSAVRYPRDNVSDRFAGEDCPEFELGKARLLTPAFADLDAERPDAAVVAYGTPAITAMSAADTLAGEYRIAVYDARFAKPIDGQLVQGLLSRGIPVVTVEDHTTIGGFGAAFIEEAAERGLDASRVTRLGIPDRWILQDSRKDQLREE